MNIAWWHRLSAPTVSQVLAGEPPFEEKGKRRESAVESRIMEIAHMLEAWAGHHEAQQVETVDALMVLSKDLTESGSEVTQILPINVFLDTQRVSDVTAVSKAVRSFASSLGFDLFFEGSGKWGSWFGRSFARSKKALTSQGVKDTMTRAERALEMQALHIPQAQIDAMQADAAAKLIAALEATPSALVQIGSVFLLKVDGTPIVRNLTQMELSYLEHNKHLYRSPKDALEELGRVSGYPERFALPLNERNLSEPEAGVGG
jgi:hypothetical protein